MFPLRYPPTLQPRADPRRTAARVSPEARAPAEALLYAHSRRRLLSTALRLLLADAASRVCTLANRLLPLPRGALGCGYGQPIAAWAPAGGSARDARACTEPYATGFDSQAVKTARAGEPSAATTAQSVSLGESAVCWSTPRGLSCPL
jgi:hypothetical protein